MKSFFSLLNKINQFRGLPREVYVISISNVVNRFGNFVVLFLALYLKDSLALDEKIVGLIISVYSSLAILGALAGGKLTDFLGRKYLLILFRGLTAVTITACCFFLKNSISIILLLISAVFRGAARPANNALIMDITNRENRKRAFSLLYFCDNVGIALGSALAGFLFENHLIWIFLGDALTTVLSIFLIAAAIKDRYVPERGDNKGEIKTRKSQPSLLSVISLSPGLIIFAFVIIFEKFVYAQNSFSLPIFLKHLFENSELYFGYLMSFNAVIVLVMTNFVLFITKRFSSLANIITGNILYAIGFGMLCYANSLAFILLSTLLWTLGEILNATNINVFIANYTPEKFRGRFSAFYHTLVEIGRMITPLLSGILISILGYTNLWFLIGSMALFTSFIVAVIWNKKDVLLKLPQEET